MSPKGAAYAAGALKHSATFLMALQIKETLKALTNKGKNKAISDPHLEDIFKIVDLIRNGFAHGPLQPCWEIKKQDKKIYEVPGIIRLDARELHGTPFSWQHYGGPLAMLKLSEYVRIKILNDNGDFGGSRNKASIEPPKLRYYQQGPVILRTLDNEPGPPNQINE
jgi:hypothetical protein